LGHEKTIVNLDLAKLTRDPKSKPKDPDPYPIQHLKYAHPKMDPKPKLTRSERCPTQNFLQSCLFWHDERISLKIG